MLSLFAACDSARKTDGPGGDTGTGGGLTSSGGDSGAGGGWPENSLGGEGGAGCEVGPDDDSGVPREDDVETPAEPVSPFIVVDQFGYLPDDEKIAVLRNPQVGADADQSFEPGTTYRLIDAVTGETILEGSPTPWNEGATDTRSGDQAYWFDFSSVTTPGIYYVLDVEQGVRSDLFRVASDVYREVLRQALRTFYYQRAGEAKEAPYAEEPWIDGPSHVGPGQDKEARLYSAANDESTARDLSGGWYDAGDYNKYTAWTADYVISLLRAYSERPEAFGDDLGIPESGNCVADILDEARFGLLHLARLQEADGGVLSIVSLAHGSPPSAASGPSRYGPATTNASLRAAAAFAWGARVLSTVNAAYGEELLDRARRAYAWAESNPDTRFYNNQGDAAGVGAGQQEPSDEQRWVVAGHHLSAALAIYRAGGGESYRVDFESSYRIEEFSLFSSAWLSGWNLNLTDIYLDYVSLPDADPSVVSAILGPFHEALGSNDNFGILTREPDPYLAHQNDYVWGSNAQKARIGLLLYSYVIHDLSEERAAQAPRAAARYVHYLHGVNPLGLVYLSNMGAFGAHKSVTQFYHTWFADGSEWDENPPPGFLTGGPNAYYNWDGQCPQHSSCPDEVPSPPFGQPDMKSYLDFNDGWPLNSWEVTENSGGYQVEYIRLLSKFVN